MLLAIDRYAAQTPEDGTERPEEPLLLHKEIALHTYRPAVEQSKNEVPVAGMRRQTDNVFVGMVNRYFSRPSHPLV